MLSNIKWMMAKNDTAKLVALYDESKAHHRQIIERLQEMEATGILLEIAKKDPIHRKTIIDDLLYRKSLNLDHFTQLLSWLNLSMTQRKVIKYLTENYAPENLHSLIEHPELDKGVKRKLMKLTGEDKRKKELANLNEDYLQIRMLLEDVELDTDIVKIESASEEEISSEMDRIKRYLNIRKKLSPQEELDLIEKEMQWWVGQEKFQLCFLLSLINLSRLRPQDKIDLIRRVDHLELLYPENFQFITENAELMFETFQSMFSLTTLGEWIRTFLTTHYAVDLHTLFKHYDQFNWLENYLHSLTIIQSIDLVNFTQSYYLTSQYGYRLNEIIPDETILRRLIEGCECIHESILTNIHIDDYPLEHFLKPLLLVGGSANFAFLAKLMDRRVVENTKQTITEIEHKYLQLKRLDNNPEELRELIEKEITEKSELISQSKYNVITYSFFESITSANYLQPRVITILKEHLPDLDQLNLTASAQGKVLLCKYIALLGLDQYRHLLDEYTLDEDYRIAVHAAITLHGLGDDKAHALLHRFVQSPNYRVRQQVASSLQLLSENLDESLIIKLAQDRHSEVCLDAIKTVNSLPLPMALTLFTKIVPLIYYKNRPSLAESLGSLGTELVLPMLTELLKNGDSDDYQAVIRALGNINSKLAVSMLHMLKLKKNPILEIERACSLIRQGDFAGWKVLESYFDFNLGFVRKVAKIHFLKLATGDKFTQLIELSHDSTPVVAALATGKLFLYDESDGLEAIERLKKSGNSEHHYYLTLLLGFLPFKKVKNILLDMKNSGSGCQMLVAITLADYGNNRILREIERNIFNISHYEQKQIIRAMQDRPNNYCLAIIKKLAMLNDPDILDDTLDLLRNYDVGETMKVIQSLWPKVNEKGHVSLARLLGKLRRADIIPFVLERLKEGTMPVKAELAYTLIVQGDESGWNILLQIMMDSNPDIMKIPIPILARLRSNEALDVLTRHLSSPSESIQAEIIKAIGSMQLRDALPILKKYVMNHSNKIKIAVAKALSEMNIQESRKLLDILATDHDEYVRVAVDIARQKQSKGFELERTTITEVFRSLFGFTNWRLPDSWFSKVAEGFRKEYEAFRPQPIASFSNKNILTVDEIDHHRGRIQDELSEQLIGCTDVEKIIAAKETANSEINNMATREELIRSILEQSSDSNDDKAWAIYRQAFESGELEIVRALVIASATSQNLRWLEILDLVAQNEEFASLSDLVIFSITNKLNGRSLPILIRLLRKERARYYFLFFFNYFIIHPDKLSVDDLKLAKAALKQMDELPRHLKDAANTILNTLMEMMI
ncbi:MAG: HEAT repeat domain-containing protein [Candidatus Cloacimonetes bacterium]|nr:HEAT repeat domain-containing protein [Candidatus Cloacimonadota bacterium]